MDSGTTSLPVLRRGKRLLKKMLNGIEGRNTKDLTLNNVVVIKGFYSNIISKARLFEIGVWYYGLDCTLRYRGLIESVVIKQMERRFNLVIFKYNTLLSYFSLLSVMPISLARILMFLTINRSIQ